MLSADIATGTLWHYLSFADDSGFLGGAYVRGDTVFTAVLRSWTLKINPGGEVQTIGPLTQEQIDANVPADHLERLLTREEVEAE